MTPSVPGRDPLRRGDGVVLLNWNGSKWTSVKTRYPTSQFDSDLTQDGHGSLWVSGYSSMAEGYAGPYLYHYSDGNWTRQLVPTTKGDRPRWVDCRRFRGRDRCGARENCFLVTAPAKGCCSSTAADEGRVRIGLCRVRTRAARDKIPARASQVSARAARHQAAGRRRGP
jgi:hypothetical protein